MMNTHISDRFYGTYNTEHYTIISVDITAQINVAFPR